MATRFHTFFAAFHVEIHAYFYKNHAYACSYSECPELQQFNLN